MQRRLILTAVNGSSRAFNSSIISTYARPLRSNLTSLSRPKPHQPHTSQPRLFSSSQILLKKGHSGKHKETPTTSTSSSSTTDTSKSSDSGSKQTFVSVFDSFKENCTRIRSFAGKTDPALIENLLVEIPPPSTAAHPTNIVHTGNNDNKHGGSGRTKQFEKHRLKDMAHVAPKSAKEIIVTVNDERHVAKIAGTILEKLHLNSQPAGKSTSSTSSLSSNAIIVSLPPPTIESRKASTAEVDEALTKVKESLTQVRAEVHKNLRKSKKGGKVSNNDMVELEKKDKEAASMLEKKLKEAKEFAESVKKQIMNG